MARPWSSTSATPIPCGWRRLKASPSRSRLAVYRSLNHIYAQVIDDIAGSTLVAASSIDGELRSRTKGLKKSDQAKLIGQTVAERAKGKGIQSVVFDRGGFRYTGRVRALADGAREAGLQF